MSFTATSAAAIGLIALALVQPSIVPISLLRNFLAPSRVVGHTPTQPQRCSWSLPHFNTIIASSPRSAVSETVYSLRPLSGDELGGCETGVGLSSSRVSHGLRGISYDQQGDLRDMHAEARELIAETYSEAPTVTGGPPAPPSAQLVSTDMKEAGLWLWQGEALSTPPRPKSRDEGFFRRIMPAAVWVGWVAVPVGLALGLLAVSMMPRPDRPVAADKPSSALSSAPSPAVPRPIVPAPPAARTETQLDQAQAPSPPSPGNLTAQAPEPPVTKRRAQPTVQAPEPPMTKGRAQHKALRTGRKVHAPHVSTRPLFPTPGVLTPPVMTWHGGGY